VIATGAVMSQAVVPLCIEHLKQIIVSYSIYKRDPPAPKAVLALKLPSCTRWDAKVRAYCTELSAAVTKLVIAERKVFPVLGGLQSAAAKLTSARRKGDKQAAQAAQAKVNKAVASLRAARSTPSAAGKELARIVRSAGIQGRLTKQQSVAVVDALLAELQKRGVPAADLRKIAPAVLQPGATDVLAALGA
jgi:predicted lipoprotein